MAKKSTFKPRNPFIYEGYEGPDYFCDRAEETEELIANLQNGRNTTLVSPRKIGKTGLIHHAFNRIKQQDKDAVCIYIDIFHTQNQYDFVQTLGKAIVEERLLDKRTPMAKVLSMVSQLQANDFIRKHDLPSASSIKKALTVLQDKDLVYQTPKGYIVYDRFLDLWLKRTFI
jgi:AAA+ ATPase superfamily predicted ATPase